MQLERPTAHFHAYCWMQATPSRRRGAWLSCLFTITLRARRWTRWRRVTFARSRAWVPCPLARPSVTHRTCGRCLPLRYVAAANRDSSGWVLIPPLEGSCRVEGGQMLHRVMCALPCAILLLPHCTPHHHVSLLFSGGGADRSHDVLGQHLTLCWPGGQVCDQP